jgi:hypothetical protein
MAFEGLKLARSRWAGQISELAVMTPIIPGRVPGERRTYEERLRTVLASLADRAEAGLPTPLSQIPTFHFARVMVIRPEHYLTHSDLGRDDVYYEEPDPRRRIGPGDQPSRDAQDAGDPPKRRIPKPLDQYAVFDPTAPPANPGEDKTTDAVARTETPGAPDIPAAQNPYGFRSWLMTLVIFDGDPNVYLRHIAEFIENDFDQVFENCEDYPYARNFERFWAWVRRYQIRQDVFYTPFPNLSVARIKQLEVFKQRFDAFVARVRTPSGARVANMDALFDQFLVENQQFANDFPSPGGAYRTTGRAE